MIIPFRDVSPQIAHDVFVAPDAWITGDVVINEKSSVFFHAVLRGDLMPIRVGIGTNLQDHCMIHTTKERTPAVLGDYVTVGHRAIIHSATIGDRCLVGMGSIVLDEAVIEDECMIGAGSLVTEGKYFPSRSLILGSPARVVRSLTDEELQFLKTAADRYIEVSQEYRQALTSRAHLIRP